MNFKQTIEKIAGKELLEVEAVKFAQDQWGMVCSWLYENQGATTGYFPVTSVHRDDLEREGFKAKKVDDETMKELASKMGEAYTEQGFWPDLELIAEDLGIIKNK